MIILGIESSCDETAAALVEDGRKVLSSIVSSQIETHALYGGVVPEIASRAHLEAVCSVVDQAVKEAGVDYDAVAVTNAPGLIGALLVGVGFAKGLAFATGKPLVPVHHLRGHVAAIYTAYPDLKPPFIALIASGGHSHIVKVKDYTDYEILGQTRDDAAGESFDKVARLIGLGYPGGAKIDRLAKDGDRYAIKFPQVRFADKPYDFSFSGVKTSVINYVHNAEQRANQHGTEINKADVAASFSHAVCSILTEKAILAAEHEGKKLVLAGGVAANSMLREYLTRAAESKGISLYIPPLSICGDNAAMIAAQGYYEYLSGNIADCSLNAYACKSIEN